MPHTPFRNSAHTGPTGATMEQNPEPDCRNLVREGHELLTDVVTGTGPAQICNRWDPGAKKVDTFPNPETISN